MKKLFLFILFVFCALEFSFAQLSPSKVDERFELTSIVFRLAGAKEYNQCGIPSYEEDIDEYFKPFSDNALIDFIRSIRNDYAIGFNAIPSIADILEIKNGKVGPSGQFNISEISEVDSRWNAEVFGKYIKLLNRFYQQSNFRKFFDDHKDLYSAAENTMDELLTTIKTDWFEQFYGKPLGSDKQVYISMSNGPHNYAVGNCILIGMPSDKNGNPYVRPYSTLRVVIHEFAHHYTNPLFFANWNEMEEAANVLYDQVDRQMIELAYGLPKAMLCEWMNNLFMLMYLRETSNPIYENDVMRMMGTGFIWMKRSIDFMDNFYAHRDLYPTIDAFMPQLVNFIKFTAANKDYIVRRPYITNVYPAVGSDISNTKEILVSFSEPMVMDGHGTKKLDDNGLKVIPLDYSKCHWVDAHTYSMSVKTEDLIPDTSYGVQLASKYFISEEIFDMGDNPCVLTFNTNKQN